MDPALNLSRDELLAELQAARAEIRTLNAQLLAAESDESLQLLADAMPQIVWITRPDGYHEFYNRRWWDYTGLTYDQARGEGWGTVLHPDDHERSRTIWADALRTGEPYEIEYRFKRAADGMYRWFLGRALPYRDEAGEIVKWFGTCTDIHDQKTAEESLRHANEEADKVVKAKDEFLSVISHELRTPLAAILGWMQLIDMGVLSDMEHKEALATIKDNARAQVQLIENMLDVSRILNNKLRIQSLLVEMHECISGAVKAVEASAASKDVQLTVEQIDRELLVNGDCARLQQVVWNLLTNAIKFTPAGGRVRVKLDRVQSCARLTVSDDGAGIEADFLPCVFERFRQGDGSKTRRHGGLGLGLSIVNYLVNLHGGSILAASDGKGRGATFTVLLPVVAVRPEDDGFEREIPVPTGRLSLDGHEIIGPEILRGTRVLVVDDEESARAVISASLSKCGAAVRLARSGEEALEMLDAVDPDIVVSDIAMNGLDGYELIARLRGLRPTLPVIALTAYASLEDRHRALDAGFDVHVSKPVEAADLIGAIRKLVSAIK